MTKKLKKRNPKSTIKAKSIETVKHLLKDTLIGSLMHRQGSQFTKHLGKYCLGTKSLNDALMHVKFKFKFMVGIIHKRTNGTPYVEYEYVTLSHQSLLYGEELGILIHKELSDKFKNANHETKLTGFWVASPNPEVEDKHFEEFLVMMMNHYKVLDSIGSNYEFDNDIVRASYHNSAYWISLLELEEITYEETI